MVIVVTIDTQWFCLQADVTTLLLLNNFSVSVVFHFVFVLILLQNKGEV